MKFIGKLLIYLLVALLIVVLAFYFLLQTRFSGEGFGKQSQVSMTSENVNMNYNHKTDNKTADQIRQDILSKLAPRGRLTVEE